MFEPSMLTLVLTSTSIASAVSAINPVTALFCKYALAWLFVSVGYISAKQASIPAIKGEA
jgi:hypothetical protein